MKMSDKTLGILAVGFFLPLEIVGLVMLFAAPILWHYDRLTASQTARYMIIGAIVNVVLYHVLGFIVRRYTEGS